MKRYLKDHIIFKGIDEKKIPEKYWNIVEDLLDITYHHSTTTVKNVAKEYNLSEKEVRKIIDSVYLKEKEIKVFKIVWLPSPYDEGIFINSLARPLYLKKIE